MPVTCLSCRCVLVLVLVVGELAWVFKLHCLYIVSRYKEGLLSAVDLHALMLVAANLHSNHTKP